MFTVKLFRGKQSEQMRLVESQRVSVFRIPDGSAEVVTDDTSYFIKPMHCQLSAKQEQGKEWWELAYIENASGHTTTRIVGE